MFELCILIVCIVMIIIIRIQKKDPLSVFEPVSDDEILLLTTIDDESLYADVLTYVRTLAMSQKLQAYLAEKKEVLDAVSYYMLLQAAKKEEEKKKTWESLRGVEKHSATHIEKEILKRIKNMK